MKPESPELMGFITGVLTAGFLVAALFFLKFWKGTGDRLFLAFAAAFALMALAQPLPLLTGASGEGQAIIYLLRLAGFGLIILGILRKNIQKKG
jgi:hypothetical protein